MFSLYFQTFLALFTIGDNRVRHLTLNWAFLHFTDSIRGKKHPNIEWRGQGSGVNSFVFVTDCSQNCPSENTTYVKTKKMHEVLSQNPNHITDPPPPPRHSTQHFNHGFLNKRQILSLFSSPLQKSNDIALLSHQSVRACKDGRYCEQDLFLQQWRPCRCVKCPRYNGRSTLKLPFH